jgi:lipoprotein-anchoring transpeptidase ErfK/SrfK
LRVVGGLVVRVSSSLVVSSFFVGGLVVIAFTLAGFSGEAAAQNYPPPPSPYPPPQPRHYDAAPLPPLDVGARYAQPPYDPGYNAPYDAQADDFPPDPRSPAGPTYVTPADRRGPPALPSLGWEGAPRPPAAIGNAPGDATGSIRAGAAEPDRTTVIAALPPDYQPEAGPAKELPPQFHRQLVDYVTPEPAGTVIIDTAHTYLYLVLGGGKALRYGVGVGREGFTWSGSERVSRMSEWPDWHPPKEMIERQPYLPRFMAGGPGNPLGARALYLGNTVYRIHGTNQPSTIGHFVSSGCIRLTNEDVEDLYSRVNLGTRIVVLPGAPSASASAQGPVAR